MIEHYKIFIEQSSCLYQDISYVLQWLPTYIVKNNGLAELNRIGDCNDANKLT